MINHGIVVDSEGNVYVVDTRNVSIIIYIYQKEVPEDI
ncbi:MAG: hypothetical protein ACE5SW_07870 [Nitrososphaeraceae archaeon]